MIFRYPEIPLFHRRPDGEGCGPPRRRARCRTIRSWAGAALLGTLPLAAFDLSRAEVSRLDNGLTVVVLEEPTLPVVSVQMLYKIGARNEPLGRSGIAHFVEHMAFRASEHFPDTEVVSAIYAVGGEWHGYTWLDQTTYFETLPADQLDLALRIEADRMARLLIPAAEVEPERGAVLAEMHGYENDPATVLKDAVLAVSFLQHPYRNNTIGWESDVRAITHDDLVAFYRLHYRPANAVLAIVGRVSRAAVVERVRELFGDLPAAPQTPPPQTAEPPQTGVRRVELQGGGSVHRFEVAYRAPAAVDPEFPSFLALQDVLGGGRGVNFAQDNFGDAVQPGTRLAGLTEDLVTWYPPQAAPYVFTIAGSIATDESPRGLETRLEEALARLRTDGPTAAEMRAARDRLADELLFDIETTEDAAHQLAYFEGLDALDVLLDLPAAVAAVTTADVRRVARRYLQPHQRTIGWYVAGTPPDVAPAPVAVPRPPSAEVAAIGQPSRAPSSPRVVRLSGGMPVLFQRLPLSPSAYLRILVPAIGLALSDPPARLRLTADHPLWRHTSVDSRFRPGELEETLRQAATAVGSAHAGDVLGAAEVADPATRLSLALDERLGRVLAPAVRGATAIALVGDLDEAAAMPLLEAVFGDWTPARVEPMAATVQPGETRIDLGAHKAQAQLGYVVLAPAPADPDWLAWRALLYVLSHGYEGRLGKEAISRRGLVYYIDARYASDGGTGRVSLEMGVDPGNLEAMQELLRRTLDELRQTPPSAKEVAEARAHLLGRRISGAQSNEEVSAALLQEWVGRGRLLTAADFEDQVAVLSAADVERIVPAFLAGATVVVDVGGRRGAAGDR